jgi:hypothetical protein
VVTLPASGDVAELAAAMTDGAGGPADVVVDPVFGWVAEAACRAMAPARSAGQPRRLRGRRGLPLVGRHPRQVPRRARLHQQLPHPEQRAEALTSVLALAGGDGSSSSTTYGRSPRSPPLGPTSPPGQPVSAGALTLAHPYGLGRPGLRARDERTAAPAGEVLVLLASEPRRETAPPTRGIVIMRSAFDKLISGAGLVLAAVL